MQSVYSRPNNNMLTFENDQRIHFLLTVKLFRVLIYITNNSSRDQSFVFIWLNNQTVLFLTIQFSMSHLFAFSLNVKQFYLTHRNLSGTTTPSQSQPESDGSEGVLCVPQSSNVTGVSPSDCLMSYQDTCWGGDFLPLCRDAVGVS